MKRNRILIVAVGILLLVSVTASITWAIAKKHKDDLATKAGHVDAQGMKTRRLSPDQAPTRRDFGSDTQFGGRSFRDILPFGEAVVGVPGPRPEILDPLWNKIEEASHVAAASGDFGQLAQIFEQLTLDQRSHYSLQIARVFSKLGPAHDVREKFSLIDQMNLPATQMAKLREGVLEKEAQKRYQELKDEEVIDTLTEEDFAGMCRNVARNRVGQAFTYVEDAVSEPGMRMAAAEVARFAIAGGAMAASKEIAALPAGLIRDEAVVELVLWLRRTKSGDEAEPWVETIQDEQAKARLAGSE